MVLEHERGEESNLLGLGLKGGLAGMDMHCLPSAGVASGQD